MLRVVDPRKFRETVGASLPRARDRIETRLDAALRQTYGRRNFDAALSKDRAVMMREIRDLVKAEAVSLGIDVVDVRIRRTDLMPEVLKDTYDRMSAERLAEAAQLRAIGESQATRCAPKPTAPRWSWCPRRAAKSEIVRGEGDGERNRVFAEAFSEGSRIFLLLPLDAGLCEKPGRCRDDADTEPDLGVLQIFRRQVQRRSAAGGAAAAAGGIEAKPPATPPPGEAGAAPVQPLNQAPAANP